MPASPPSPFGDPNEGVNLKYTGNFKHNINSTQAINYAIWDSLDNGYSYFSSRQQPYVYHIETGTLYTIKRGAGPRDDASYGTNVLDNLFFRSSTDWGQTWTDPELLYDASNESPGFYARYPSIYPFILEGQLCFNYTSPLTGGEGWQGWLNSIYYFGAPLNTFMSNAETETGGIAYGWGTDAKLLGGTTNPEQTEPYFLAIGGLMPPGGNRDGAWDDNSNVAYRKTADFTLWDVIVPDAWASDNFYPVDADSNTSSVIYGLKKGPDDKMYAGIIGNFIDSEDPDLWEVGVSFSEDYGETWSNLDICPISLLWDYATANGLDPDSVSNYSAYDFLLYEYGDGQIGYSVFVWMSDFRQGVAPLDRQMQIVEYYKQGGTWGIRKVGDISGYTLPYWDEDAQSFSARNQMGIELNAALTEDGTKMLLKWVDLTNLADDGAGNITFNGSDIFISTKTVTGNTWGDVQNISDDDGIHRITWIPDYVPNSLIGIPMIEEISIADPNDTDQEAAIRGRNLLERQYCLIGYFDAVVGVEKGPENDGKISINSIYPNPASSYTQVSVNIPADGEATIELFDLMGNKVVELHDGFLSAGSHAIYLPTDNLSIGTYYCTLNMNGYKTVKTLTIVR